MEQTAEERMHDALDEGLRKLEADHSDTVQLLNRTRQTLRTLEQTVFELRDKLQWYERRLPEMAEARTTFEQQRKERRQRRSHGLCF